MELDRHKLEEERRWRFENYKQQVERLVSSLVDAIQMEGRRVLEREIEYSDDMRDEYSYVQQAGQLQHAILQAINNADFGGLTRDAGNLHAVEMALHMLPKLKAALPTPMRLELEAAENEGLRERIDEKVARIEELDERERVLCVSAVHQPRGGYHRCQKNGKHPFVVDSRPGYRGTIVEADDPNAMEVLVCGTHAKDAERGRISVYQPSAWDSEQNRLWREKEQREILAMRYQLNELSAGQAPKEIEAITGKDSA